MINMLIPAVDGAIGQFTGGEFAEEIRDLMFDGDYHAVRCSIAGDCDRSDFYVRTYSDEEDLVDVH